MKCVIRHVIFAALFVLPFAAPASAQYMFLDTNGDGVNTSADVLAPNGTPTTVDVYVNTNHNADGSLAVCNTGDGDLGIWNSYVVNLQASGGTVTYGTPTNQQSSFTIVLSGASNSTELTFGRATGSPEPGGYERMFTVTITGVTGSPTIDFVPFGTLAVDATSFGTPCSGSEGDNTYKLGSDWQDTAGLGAASGGNANPTISAPATATGTEGQPITITATATDSDAADVLTITATGYPTSLTLTNPTGSGTATATLSGTLGFGDQGTYPIVWSVSDGTNPAVTTTTNLTVTNVDRAPTVTAPATISGSTGTPITFTVSASDPDGDALIALAAAPLPAGATFTANASNTSGTFTWTPTSGQTGTFNVTFSAVNAQTGTATTAITVAGVDAPPTVTAPATASGTEGALLTVVVSATDPDGAITSLTASPLPAGATFTANATNTSGTLSWTPSLTQSGTYSVTFTASNELSGSATTVITIANADQAPVVTAPATASGATGELITFTVTAADPDGDAITSLTAAPLPTGATFTANATNTSGTFSWTPDAGDIGSTSVTFTASNALSGSATTSITVTDGDHAPTVTAPATISGDEGTLITFTVSATDSDGDAIASLTAAPLPAGASFTANATNTSGTFSWTPTLTQSGSYTVTFTASNALSGSAATTITVNNVDQAPTVSAPATVSGAEGTLVTYVVTAADPDGDAITSLTAGPLPTGATFTADATNTSATFSWTPDATQAGTYTITATATNALSGTATTEVTIDNADVAPSVTAPTTITGAEGTNINFTVSASDPDGDAIASLTAAPLPAGATFTANATNTSGTFDWTPAAGQAGTYSVTFTASNALSGSATTSISVSGVNRDPVVSAPSTFTANEGETITFLVTATDEDGDAVALTAAGLPAGATFTDNGNSTGTFVWTPTFTQSGSYTVTFIGNDGNGGTATATTAITVGNVNRDPVADAGGPYTGVVNIPITFDGTGSTDPDGDVLTYAWDFGDGTTGTGPSPSHTYTAAGPYTVTLVVTDPSGASSTDVTSASIVTSFPASGFAVGGNKVTSLGSGKPYTCLQIESVGGSFSTTDVILSSITMSYTGGTVTEISADASKTSVDGDKNGNGLSEITACFTKEDLRLLFSGLSAGRHTVTVTLEGDLTSGGTFSGTATLIVKSSGGALAASVTPNPLNPIAKLNFATSKSGALRVQMYDPQGRLVKTIADETNAAAGYHDFTIDGLSARGTKLASGVYFVKIWSQHDGQDVTSVTILK